MRGREQLFDLLRQNFDLAYEFTQSLFKIQ